ncbi:hypothetical protein MA16_Dca027990 [Dendrobium catenatum]|uniref:Uncharacterized protein n=1 Tax=Dendrobium catenatum TaxID=906689 RepID=A0A2I0VFP4_9ASPA|nr:hypothetical protein MA16_Dca027990 [Dendrobium catenatum]
MHTLAKVSLVFAAVTASMANGTPTQLEILEIPSGVQQDRGKFFIFIHSGMEGNSLPLGTNSGVQR